MHTIDAGADAAFLHVDLLQAINVTVSSYRVESGEKGLLCWPIFDENKKQEERREGRVASACAGGGEGGSRVLLALEAATSKQAEPKHTDWKQKKNTRLLVVC